jgi:hypothetical protein
MDTNFNRKAAVHHIKVNFPESEADYIRGSGEGMWVLVDDEGKRAYDLDYSGVEYQGILDNDSFCWNGLEHGCQVPIEMRGDMRPVVPFDWLYKMFGN